LPEATGSVAPLCVCGLAAEARVARAAGFPVVVGAADRRRTTALVESSVSRVSCLVSFGLAGALAPELRVGEVIVSTDVIAANKRWWAGRQFRDRVADLARGIGARQGAVLGVEAILATAAQKSRAWNETRASAADLESDIVAALATSAGIPFVVVRAISDPAQRELPPAALLPLSEDGVPKLARVLASVLRRPNQITALIGLARDTRTALSALAGPARVLHALVTAAA